MRIHVLSTHYYVDAGILVKTIAMQEMGPLKPQKGLHTKFWCIFPYSISTQNGVIYVMFSCVSTTVENVQMGIANAKETRRIRKKSN